ncbi:hypothetical protein [Bacillus subtilis]|uniref:hypothetical protein n=1 Tax=Bacillus subtilis TaxID=1423 RepID=UPI003F87BB52
MAKTSLVEVIGLKKNTGIDPIATFSTKGLANWHINNTFGDRGFDKLLTRNVSKKGENFIPDTLAEDKNQYVHVKAGMKSYDWDTLNISVVKGTLLGFYLDGLVKSEKTIGKLGTADFEGDEAQVSVVLGMNDPIPYNKLSSALEKVIVESIVGDTEAAAAVEDEESEDVVEEQSTPDEDNIDNDDDDEADEDDESELEVVEYEDDDEVDEDDEVVDEDDSELSDDEEADLEEDLDGDIDDSEDDDDSEDEEEDDDEEEEEEEDEEEFDLEEEDEEEFDLEEEDEEEGDEDLEFDEEEEDEDDEESIEDLDAELENLDVD